MPRLNLYTLLPLVFCTSCAVTYAPPQAGPIAKINIVNKSNKNLNIAFYETSHGCKRRQKTSPILPGKNDLHLVKAGEPLTFLYYLTTSQNEIDQISFGAPQSELYCIVNLRFQPTPNKDYDLIASQFANKCTWVMKEHSSGGSPQLINLESIEWRRAATESGSWCKE